MVGTKQINGPGDITLGEALDVKKPLRAGLVVSVRLSAEEADRLVEVADERHEAVTSVARAAISAYLAATESEARAAVR